MSFSIQVDRPGIVGSNSAIELLDFVVATLVGVTFRACIIITEACYKPAVRIKWRDLSSMTMRRKNFFPPKVDSMVTSTITPLATCQITKVGGRGSLS